MAEPRRLHEPRRPRVSLMLSLPSQTETHWMIMLQIGQKSLRLPFFSIYNPPFAVIPSPPPSITLLLLSFPIVLLSFLLLSVSIHPSFHSQTFSEVLPIWSSGNTLRDFGQIWWCSLPTVAFNQSKSYFGDEQGGSCFFHELLYNRITQPEGQVPHHQGLHRSRWSSYLKMSFEYCLRWLAGCALL